MDFMSQGYFTGRGKLKSEIYPSKFLISDFSISAFCFYPPGSILKKPLRFLPPVDIAVEDPLDFHAFAGGFVEN
jgi:hypothetical protein